MTKIDKVLYTGKTHTIGGRDGFARSDDGQLEVKLSPPGTPQAGTNPEQLFAAGWSACFIGAMGLAAGKRKLREKASEWNKLATAIAAAIGTKRDQIS